jgi:para-aminobenzoate synthetase component I
MTGSPFPRRTARLVDRRIVARGAGDAAFLRLAHDAGHCRAGVVLLSGSGHEAARWSIAGWDPCMVLRTRGTTARVLTADGEVRAHGNPLSLIDQAQAAITPGFDLDGLPFAGGAIGYLSYDLKNAIERLPARARAERQLPDLFLLWPRKILLHDRTAGTVESLTLAVEGADGPLLPGPAPACAGAPAFGPVRATVTRDRYLRAVERIRDYIARGDVYQVNLSQRFAARFRGDPWHLWTALFERNPAPFYAYVQAGDHQVVSSSMERFLRVEGRSVESRPIKGTRPRGTSPAEDAAQRDELLHSAKDDAELSMIVDLIRNDLGWVCTTGSVTVAEHRRLESYANVHHLVSVVRGTLRGDVSAGALLRATFPGGSITGCPKIRAMEIIDELEPAARHVYTGAIGYLGWHGTVDLNVAIRTALVHRGACSLSVGGGVVYDSQAADEYDETLAKGRTFFELMGSAGGER